MHLENYIQQFTLDQILEIEHQDEQRISLARAWKAIELQTTLPREIRQNIFIFLVIQNALVSYQVAGSWPAWRNEFSEKIPAHIDHIHRQMTKNISLRERRLQFLLDSRHNKRLYNNKADRIAKSEKLYEHWDITDKTFSFKEIYTDMFSLNKEIAHIMWQSPDAKTITFATKMFGYAASIVYGLHVEYPMDVRIPVDSRLQQIYKKHFPGHTDNEKTIQAYFQNLAESSAIPPLHLDSLLWIEYWKNLTS